jgi:SAM-dependent methyltransferase
MKSHEQTASPSRETGDVESSTNGYARRFAGAAGAWMLRVQEELAFATFRKWPGGTVLDVGGGHGQIAVPLARGGWQTTVYGSMPSCGERLRSLLPDGSCRFLSGDLLQLPFPDRHFDIVSSFRLLTHCERWERLVGELCRVARHAVVVDYPTSQSLNVIAPALFGAKKRLEGDTRQWHLFRHEEVSRAFVRNGFAGISRRRQFFLPMVVHRKLGMPALSKLPEGLFRLTGLTGLFGSPVVLEARRRKEGG